MCPQTHTGSPLLSFTPKCWVSESQILSNFFLSVNIVYLDTKLWTLTLVQHHFINILFLLLLLLTVTLRRFYYLCDVITSFKENNFIIIIITMILLLLQQKLFANPLNGRRICDEKVSCDILRYWLLFYWQIYSSHYFCYIKALFYNYIYLFNFSWY